MLANQFTEAFREEHRQMRDMLLGLMDAIEANDVESVRRGIEEMAAQTGPHFHHEEEVLYPALAEIYGDEYVERLGAEHDAALEAVQELAELSEAEEITPQQAEYGLELVRRLLPHVSDRDGLAVIVEYCPRRPFTRSCARVQNRSVQGKPCSRWLKRRRRAGRRDVGLAGSRARPLQRRNRK
jgi:hemerythrin